VRRKGAWRSGFPLDNLFVNQHLYWLYSDADFFLSVRG
jgi:hypothetical protein